MSEEYNHADHGAIGLRSVRDQRNEGVEDDLLRLDGHEDFHG